MSGPLIRPIPVHGESRQGYLLRLSGSNALASPRRIKADWLGVPASCAALRGPIAGLGVLNAPDPGGLSARYWNTRRPRYCPHCLEEAPHWRSVWGLVFYVACHRHEAALVDDCGGCGRPLRWVRQCLLRCPCGADLRDRTPRAASAQAIAAGRALAASWCDGETPSELRTGDIDIEGLLYRTWLLGSYRSQTAERAQKLVGLHAMPQAMRIVEAAADVLSGGETGYFDFLDQVAARYGDPNSSRLSKRFGAFYKELFDPRWERALLDVRVAFEQYVAQRWPGQLAARNRRLSKDTRDAHAWVALTSAAKALRWKTARLRSAVERGVVRGHLANHESGRISGTIHRNDLARLLNQAGDEMTLVDVCAALRLGKKSVKTLVAAGSLVPSSGPPIDGLTIWRFPRGHVDAFIASSKTGQSG